MNFNRRIEKELWQEWEILIMNTPFEVIIDFKDKLTENKKWEGYQMKLIMEINLKDKLKNQYQYEEDLIRCIKLYDVLNGEFGNLPQTSVIISIERQINAELENFGFCLTPKIINKVIEDTKLYPRSLERLRKIEVAIKENYKNKFNAFSEGFKNMVALDKVKSQVNEDIYSLLDENNEKKSSLENRGQEERGESKEKSESKESSNL